MLLFMKRQWLFLVFGGWLAGVSGLAGADDRLLGVIPLEFWSVPRHASQILQQPPLVEAVRILGQKTGARLILVHPAGETGEVWGQELRLWLVALGLESDRILLRAGAADQLVEVLVGSTDVSPPAVSERKGEGEGVQQ